MKLKIPNTKGPTPWVCPWDVLGINGVGEEAAFQIALEYAQLEEILKWVFTKWEVPGILSWTIDNFQCLSRKSSFGTSLVAQWLRLCAPNAGVPGSIPGQGTRSHMHAATKSSHATTEEPACCN